MYSVRAVVSLDCQNWTRNLQDRSEMSDECSNWFCLIFGVNIFSICFRVFKHRVPVGFKYLPEFFTLLTVLSELFDLLVGLSIHTFHGNFFVRSTDLLSLANVNPDAGFAVQMSIEESLTDTSLACFQTALLYTSSKGNEWDSNEFVTVRACFVFTMMFV